MNNKKFPFYRGAHQYNIFDDAEFDTIDQVSRQDALDRLHPFFLPIMQAMDDAFEKVSKMIDNNPDGYNLVHNAIAVAVLTQFCSNLQLIDGLQVTRGPKNTVSVEVMGTKIRLWIRKFRGNKHMLSPNSRNTYLKLNGKTDDKDTRPLIILGYTATKDNKKYAGLYFTQQRNQQHLDWEINIPEVCIKEETYFTTPASMVADDGDDIPMAIKQGALLKSIIKQ